MEIIRNILDLNKAILKVKNLGFVPTMGGLHKGHISLIKSSQNKCRKTIVSIYVNPTQFNKKKDFNKYPRNINRDIIILKNLKVDFLFLPKTKDIYKLKRINKIRLKSADRILCGKFRKGHFEGVLDVMDRFLSIIKPNYVFMGEKDFQQLFLIKKFIKNKYNSKIITCPTVREGNKIALSSRNFLLGKKDLYNAGLIAQCLFQFKSSLLKNNKKIDIIIPQIKKKLENKYKIKIEYLEVRNTYDLKKTNFLKKYKIFIAYYINKVRLIDNF